MNETTDTFKTLRVDPVKNGVALITLNRPEQLNAMTFTMFTELLDVSRMLETDEQVRAVIITGAGRGFCSGLDLADAKTIPQMSMGENLRGQEHWARCVTSFHTMNKPVIAAVNGPAAGAGFALALAADIRLASDKARFNAAFIRIGLSGGDCGSSYFLPRIVGLGVAYEILLTGRIIESDEALRIGLVNKVVANENLLAAAFDLAALIVSNSPIGVHLTKQLISTNIDAPSLQAALELENRSQVLTGQTEDMREALSAFLEKRAPRYHAK